MYYRYLDLPFKIKKPDRSVLNEFTGCNVIGVAGNDFVLMNTESDLDSYRNASYDKNINLNKMIKFDFQYDFEKWFCNYTDEIKLSSYYIFNTKEGTANSIHSDAPKIKAKINFVFADYNSCFEYFDSKNTYEYKGHGGDTGTITSADEKDCTLVKKLKYENYYPILLDATSLHRGNNRNCNSKRLTISYQLTDKNNNYVKFDDAVKIFKDVLVPVENKFYMLSDF